MCHVAVPAVSDKDTKAPLLLTAEHVRRAHADLYTHDSLWATTAALTTVELCLLLAARDIVREAATTTTMAAVNFERTYRREQFHFVDSQLLMLQAYNSS